jgi:hypothetical protein
MAVAGPLTSRDNTAIGLNHTIVPARDHIARAVAIEIAALPLRRNAERLTENVSIFCRRLLLPSSNGLRGPGSPDVLPGSFVLVRWSASCQREFVRAVEAAAPTPFTRAATNFLSDPGSNRMAKPAPWHARRETSSGDIDPRAAARDGQKSRH